MSPTPMSDATVCMPWRAQPDRIAAYERVTKYWEDHGFTVVTADSNPVLPFVCNEARNNAAMEADTPIIIMADADTLPDHIDQITAGIKAITADEPLADIVYPFTMYRYIDGSWASRPDEDFRSPDNIIGETYNSPGGILIARAADFWDIGGFDERFIPGASGFDDTAFYYAAQTLKTVLRIYGTVWSFDHPMSVERKYDDTNPNYSRFCLYEWAKDQPDLMAEVVK